MIDRLKSESLALRQNAVSRLDARVKLVLTLAFTFAVVSVPFDRPFLLFPLSLILAMAVGAGEVPLGHLARRLLLGLPFVALIALFPLLFETRTVVVTAGGAEFTATVGIVKSASVLARFALAFGAAIVLTSTTPFARIVEAMSQLRLPAPFTAAVSLTWRYLSVLAAEGSRMLTARAARSPRRSPIGLAWSSSGAIIGGLFVRAMDRSQRVQSAMEARGFNGRFQTPLAHPMRPADWIVLMAFMVLFAASSAASLAGVL